MRAGPSNVRCSSQPNWGVSWRPFIQNEMSDGCWFGAKTLYRWPDFYTEAGRGEYVYEERVVVLRARNQDDAIVHAEAEAIEYASAANEGMEYLRSVEVYEMFDDIGHGAEVFSLLRTTPLDPPSFLERYHNPAGLHSRAVGEDLDPAS